jgi:hypothetical protein
VLPRPRGGHVGEAGHSHAMRQPPRDGRFHEIGRQEGKRDRYVDLPNAAPLALGDAFRICVRVGKKGFRRRLWRSDRPIIYAATNFGMRIRL